MMYWVLHGQLGRRGQGTSDAKPQWKGGRDHETRFKEPKRAQHIRGKPSTVLALRLESKYNWVLS